MTQKQIQDALRIVNEKLKDSSLGTMARQLLVDRRDELRFQVHAKRKN